jgi:hypothetical protein
MAMLQNFALQKEKMKAKYLKYYFSNALLGFCLVSDPQSPVAMFAADCRLTLKRWRKPPKEPVILRQSTFWQQ